MGGIIRCVRGGHRHAGHRGDRVLKAVGHFVREQLLRRRRGCCAVVAGAVVLLLLLLVLLLLLLLLYRDLVLQLRRLLLCELLLMVLVDEMLMVLQCLLFRRRDATWPPDGVLTRTPSTAMVLRHLPLLLAETTRVRAHAGDLSDTGRGKGEHVTTTASAPASDDEGNNNDDINDRLPFLLLILERMVSLREDESVASLSTQRMKWYERERGTGPAMLKANDATTTPVRPPHCLQY
uniref:Uncharacterized protein n=1 Tax=Anopheles farauti TaxID=69004 RepID=A0A182R0P2_9DIPT